MHSQLHTTIITAVKSQGLFHVLDSQARSVTSAATAATSASVRQAAWGGTSAARCRAPTRRETRPTHAMPTTTTSSTSKSPGGRRFISGDVTLLICVCVMGRWCYCDGPEHLPMVQCIDCKDVSQLAQLRFNHRTIRLSRSYDVWLFASSHPSPLSGSLLCVVVPPGVHP